MIQDSLRLSEVKYGNDLYARVENNFSCLEGSDTPSGLLPFSSLCVVYFSCLYVQVLELILYVYRHENEHKT